MEIIKFTTPFDALFEIASGDILKSPPKRINKKVQNKSYLEKFYADYNPPMAPKKYSYGRVKKVLNNVYDHYRIKPLIIGDKQQYVTGTHQKYYMILDLFGNIVIPKCSLTQIGRYLEEQGDYYLLYVESRHGKRSIDI